MVSFRNPLPALLPQLAQETLMTHLAQVDPSVSKTPLPLDAEGLSTVCVLCSHDCGIQVDVKGGKIVKVRADETNPISKGYICNKGFSVAHYAHHDQL